jgi:hypothetical protein
MKQSNQISLGEKTEYRKSVEYLAQLSTAIERGVPIGELVYETNARELAKHLRRILYSARG